MDDSTVTVPEEGAGPPVSPRTVPPPAPPTVPIPNQGPRLKPQPPRDGVARSGGGSGDGTDYVAGVMSVLLGLAIGGSVVGSALYNYFGLGADKLDIVTSAVRVDTTSWQLSGRVLNDGVVVRARVWAIATDHQGNRYSPSSTTTDTAGQFTLRPVPQRLGTDTAYRTSDITVFARSIMPADTGRAASAGQEFLRLTSGSRTRSVRLPPFALSFVGVIFLVSILVGLLRGKPGGWVRRVQYYGDIALAFMLTAAVIGYISVGLRHVESVATRGDVVALGFANIYSGTYVKDLPPEWLLSLTAPGNHAVTDGVSQGFGAPLWALLLAVVGSAIFTVSLIVKQISDPVSLDDDSAFRKRLEEIVRHQFYILFAPVGAVFVYQLLVAAGAASEQATVALAMLAAGVMLNILLDKAVNIAKNALK
jgi:hypothetical protein